jgi:Uma2 family endonuclease
MLLARRKVRPKELSDQKSHPGRRMTEKEFVDWCDSDTWAEWVDGKVIVISPVNLDHAYLFTFLLRLLAAFVEEHDLGTVLSEPFQVRFGTLRRRRSPDIIFVSTQRMANLKRRELEGAPDLIIEVVSPESQSRDRREKFGEYQSAGVREYWIVDPLSTSIEAYALGKNKKFALIEPHDDAIHSKVLPRFYLKPAWLWQAKLPKVSTLLREMASKR